jgi:lipoprotein-anchoring transpeptidase ErfK/SrfK
VTGSNCVSHGCVRLDDAALAWLVVTIGPGTPVLITR